MSRPRRSLFPLLLVLAAGCVEAYMGSASEFRNLASPDAILGTSGHASGSAADSIYVLQTINGNPLPFVVAESTDLGLKVEFTAGRAQVNGDGTCSISRTVRRTIDGVVTTETETDTCAWTADDTSITLTTAAGQVLKGSLVDGTLTVTDAGGFVLMFVRE